MRNIDRYVEGTDYRVESFTPVDAQTLFVLAVVPVEDATVAVYVNGIKYALGVNYTVSGANITWLDVPFSIQATDSFEVTYVVRS